MNAEIVCVGTELLLGETVNTHAAFLSQRLAEYGIDVYHHVTVGDNPARLDEALRQAAGRARVVIVTGGLGPTGDDLTREAIAAVTGRPLVLDEGVLEEIRRRLAGRGRPMTPGNRKQALFPEGSAILPNPHGTAPGFVLPWRDGRWFVALPGPPRELQPMVDGPLRPFLERWAEAAGRPRLVKRVLRIAGLGESEVEHRLADLFASQGDVTLATYAKEGEVHLRLATKVAGAATRLDELAAEIGRRLGLHVYGEGDEPLEAVVGRLLRQRGETVAVAESCTGGRVADRLTNVPGSSAYVVAGVVAYANQAKVQALAVRPHDLAAHGAVSEPVARAMAAGVRRFFGAHWGVATTGIAGPGGGTPEKPVGTVYVAVDGPAGTRVERYRWAGDRQAVKTRSAQAALFLLYRALREAPDPARRRDP